MNLKGPQPREPEDRPKVSKWVVKIQELEQRVTSLEVYIKDLELDVNQARIALIRLMDGLQVAQNKVMQGLTENPYPFDVEQKKVWESAKINAVIQKNDPKNGQMPSEKGLPY